MTQDRTWQNRIRQSPCWVGLEQSASHQAVITGGMSHDAHTTRWYSRPITPGVSHDAHTTRWYSRPVMPCVSHSYVVAQGSITLFADCVESLVPCEVSEDVEEDK